MFSLSFNKYRFGLSGFVTQCVTDANILKVKLVTLAAWYISHRKFTLLLIWCESINFYISDAYSNHVRFGSNYNWMCSSYCFLFYSLALPIVIFFFEWLVNKIYENVSNITFTINFYIYFNSQRNIALVRLIE